jgi:hypothetical protein
MSGTVPTSKQRSLLMTRGADRLRVVLTIILVSCSLALVISYCRSPVRKAHPDGELQWQ